MEIRLFTHENLVGNEITSSLSSGRYSNFKMAVAYAKNSGIGRIYNELSNYTNNGGVTEAVIGIDQNITSYQALLNLRTFTGDNLYVHYDKGPSTFHPKLYLFGNSEVEKVIVGSSNLTAGGLYINYEANVGINLDTSQISVDFKDQINHYWHVLSNDSNTVQANLSFITQLLEAGKITDENKEKTFQILIDNLSGLPFRSRSVPTAPSLSSGIITNSPIYRDKFAMTLSRFDVSSRSQDPVILIPLAALRMNPTYWNWPTSYMISSGGYPQYYSPAQIQINGTQMNQIIRIYYYERKKEFRMQCEGIKRNGQPDDIILIQKNPSSLTEYKIELIRTNSQEYNSLRPLLTDTTPGRHKFFKYL